jgi:hypothetical protein
MSKKKLVLINTNLKATIFLTAPGNTITEEQFCALVGITFIPTNVFNSMPFKSQYLYFSSKIRNLLILNRVLALRGLQYKSKDYCSSFIVTANIEYAKRRSSNSSTNSGIRFGNMISGEISHHGTWSSLTKAEGSNLYYGYSNRSKV